MFFFLRNQGYFIHNFWRLHPNTYKDILKLKGKDNTVLVSSWSSPSSAVGAATCFKPTSIPTKKHQFLNASMSSTPITSTCTKDAERPG